MSVRNKKGLSFDSPSVYLCSPVSYVLAARHSCFYNLLKYLMSYPTSAEERTRTSTRLPGPDPESGASTNSATSAQPLACVQIYAGLIEKSSLRPPGNAVDKLRKPVIHCDTLEGVPP